MSGFQRSGQMDRGCGCGTRRFASELLAEKALAKGMALPGAGAAPRIRECPRIPGTWHLIPVQEETGFSDQVKLQVRTRAGSGDPAYARCEACGRRLGRRRGQVHHVVNRGMGGCRGEVINSAANAALLCGTPLTGCHGLATALDPDMEARGFCLPQGTDPRAVPMMLASRHGSGITVWRAQDGLGPDGSGYLFEPPAVAA